MLRIAVPNKGTLSETAAAMLAEATKHHDESAERLEADLTEAARERAEAVAEAEQTKVRAIEEADARLGAVA